MRHIIPPSRKEKSFQQNRYMERKNFTQKTTNFSRSLLDWILSAELRILSFWTAIFRILLILSIIWKFLWVFVKHKRHGFACSHTKLKIQGEKVRTGGTTTTPLSCHKKGYICYPFLVISIFNNMSLEYPSGISKTVKMVVSLYWLEVPLFFMLSISKRYQLWAWIARGSLWTRGHCVCVDGQYVLCPAE